jgi:hypothetical protein
MNFQSFNFANKTGSLYPLRQTLLLARYQIGIRQGATLRIKLLTN